MHLTETHHIKRGHSLYPLLNSLSRNSKDIWNMANYIVRQEFIRTSSLKEAGEVTHATWIRWVELDKILKTQYPLVYQKLPAKSVQLLLKQLDETWKSYFRSVKDWSKNKSKYHGKPQLPKYKDKDSGKNLVILNNQQFKIKDGVVTFLSSLTKPFKFKKIKTNIDSGDKLVQLRLVPLRESYNLEIVYQIQDSILKANQGLNIKTGEVFSLDVTKFASIDLGLDNFVTMTDNIGHGNVILNGKPIKSINQYANKFQGLPVSQRKKDRVWKKRTFKIKHILHHFSNFIVTNALERGIKTIVVGNNKNWKQGIKLGKRTNQKFVQVPYKMFLDMLRYKCHLANLDLIETEESYTSKCSFIDGESLGKHNSYLGKRVSRGLFKSKKGRLINADLNGALNIGRKVFPKGFVTRDGIEGFVVSPRKLTFHG